MLSSLTTKLALRKMGISSDTFNFSNTFSSPEPTPTKKLTRKGTAPALDEEEENSSAWPAWMSVRKLPLTVQPWLSPPPPPVAIAAECPRVGDLAPLDRDRLLTFGGGKKVVVVFLRCVGCAFAQKTFLALRALATKHTGSLTCIAVSHSSPAATQKWLDLLGGAWNVQVVVDEDRAVYAAWGLGLGSVWYVLNPTTQVQGWKEKGWLGASVATSMQRTGVAAAATARSAAARPGRVGGTMAGGGSGGVGIGRTNTGGTAAVEPAPEGGPTTLMGNKWQESGAWAVDGRGTVVWGGKALRADDVPDLDAGVRALGL